MKSHTPGPWAVKDIHGNPFVAAKTYEGHPYHKRSPMLEIMSDENYPTKWADARLIAQTPRLLNVLRSIVEINPELPMGMIEEAQEVIYEATGEEV